MSLRARIATIVAATVAFVVIVTGLGVQALSTATLIGAIDDDLRSLARMIESDARGLRVVTRPGRGRLGGAAGIVQIIDRDGAIQRLQGPLSAQGFDVQLPIDEAVREVVQAGRASLMTVTVDDTRLRMLVVPLNQQFAVQVARPLDEVDQVATLLRQRTWYASGLGAALAAFAAWFIAGRSIRPVSELTRTIEAVKDDMDIARGMPLGDQHVGRHDEVARLARAFDAMLSRLDASRLAQEQLAADAAHELKTPLTSLQTNIEVLSLNSQRLSPEDQAQLTNDVLMQLDELNTMIDGLVAIARIDANVGQHASVELNQIVTDVLAAARRRYPTRADDLRYGEQTDDPVTITGDVRDLELAISALIDNATKSAPDGPIVISVTRDDTAPSTVHIRVCDQGPGVDETLIDQLFQRFFRSPEARGMPGAGLGLALVKRVAKAHFGDATAHRNDPQGLCVTISLPTSPR